MGLGSAFFEILTRFGISTGLKKSLAKIAKLSPNLNDKQFMIKLKTYIDGHPNAVSGLVGAMGSVAPDMVIALYDVASPEQQVLLAKLLKGIDALPKKYLTGPDGEIDEVWGENSEDFSKHLSNINRAKKVVEDAAFILGIEPKAVIELASLLRGIEPQFSQLY